MDSLTRDQPQKRFYKQTLEESMPFEVSELPPAKGVKQEYSTIKQRRLYNARCPVTVAKRNDLLDLLPYIPPIHLELFTSLKTSQDNDEESGPLEEVDGGKSDAQQSSVSEGLKSV